MRVLLVSQEYPPETAWGGIATYLGLHAPALAARGHEVHVLSCADGQEDSDAEPAPGLVVHRRGLLPHVPGSGRITPLAVRRLRVALSVAREVRALGGLDLVEAPEWMAESLLLPRRGLPTVVRLHSPAAEVFRFTGRTGLDTRLAVRLEDRAMGRADCLIGSEVTASHARRVGSGAPIFEIPYPVPELEPRESWDDGPPRVVFAGRFESRKGADVAIEALPTLLERRPDSVLQLVGRDTGAGDDGASVIGDLLGRARRLGVGDSVEVIERWGFDAVESARAGSAVCVVPSRWESGGYTAAEAIMGGTPTLVSPAPSLAALAGGPESGRVIPLDRPQAWGEALAELISGHESARRATLAQREDLLRFRCPDAVAAATENAYEAAIQYHQGRR